MDVLSIFSSVLMVTYYVTGIVYNAILIHAALVSTG